MYQMAQSDVKRPQITDEEKEALRVLIKKSKVWIKEKQDEKKALAVVFKKGDDWIEEKQEAQLTKAPCEDPALASVDVPLESKQVVHRAVGPSLAIFYSKKK